MADSSDLILVWGMEGDESFHAVRISDLLAHTLPKTDYYPVLLRRNGVSISAGYDCPVEPLEIMTGENFLASYTQPGRLPELGEVLEGVRIDEPIPTSEPQGFCSCGHQAVGEDDMGQKVCVDFPECKGSNVRPEGVDE